MNIIFLGSFISLFLGFGVYQYYRYHVRKRNLENKARNKAIDEFKKIIRQIDGDLDDMDLIIKWFQIRVHELFESWSCLDSQKPSNPSVSVSSKTYLSYDWTNLLDAYNEAVKEYPKTPAFKNLSTQQIYQQCNLFQAYHENVLGLCEHFAEKSAQDIARYEDALSRDYDLQKMKK